jgi:hypothetical protein
MNSLQESPSDWGSPQNRQAVKNSSIASFFRTPESRSQNETAGNSIEMKLSIRVIYFKNLSVSTHVRHLITMDRDLEE